MNGKRIAQRGHILLVAIILATVLSIMLAAAIRPVRTASQRQKEAQLVYRGEHLAEGIRRFYFHFGRFPFNLDELVEQKPRFVRKLYKDPMTEEGEWTLVYLTPTDMAGVAGLNQAARRALEAMGGEVEQESNSENQADADSPLNMRDSLFQRGTQQITGIRSKSDDSGFRVYQDSQIYSDWLFSALPKKQVGVDDLLENIQNKAR